jgi:acetone carboxylase gamma subunit
MIVEIPDDAKESLRMLFSQRQQAEQMIQTYIRALQDSLNVKGDGWTLNIADMVFVKESPNGKVEADVVGAVTGDSTGE